MSQHSKNPPEGAKNRRDFLKFAGVAAPVAAVSLGGQQASAAPQVKLSDRGDACMQDTDHTRTYYDLARRF